jgi:hypothetical protein
MVSSSVSTYLDVTQAARGATAPAPDANNTDPEFTAQAAKVLATINGGTELLTELPERSGMETAQVLTLLSWLSSAGLVEVDDEAGDIRARLTHAARTALATP